MRVVVDTNVVVSAMLSGAGAPAEVLLLILQGDATLLLDARIEAEYDEVTARPRFGFDPRERRVILDTLSDIAEHVISSPLPLRLPDPGDQVLLEVAVAGRADALITGNLRHFPRGRAGPKVPILTPRRFMERLRR